MQIYGSFGPNPRALRMFVAEKGITIPTKELDILGAENRRAPYTDKNPGGQLPALELDDGTVIGETVAIFEYLEEQNPKPPLVGTNAKERAETRMWQRRVEQRITENLYNGFRFAEGLALFKDRMRCLPEAAAGLKQIAQRQPPLARQAARQPTVHRARPLHDRRHHPLLRARLRRRASARRCRAMRRR